MTRSYSVVTCGVCGRRVGSNAITMHRKACRAGRALPVLYVKVGTQPGDLYLARRKPAVGDTAMLRDAEGRAPFFRVLVDEIRETANGETFFVSRL